MTSTKQLVARIEDFVKGVVAPYESDPRCGGHGPEESLVQELRDKARATGLMTPHIGEDGAHLSHRDTAEVLIASGYSPLGPVAMGTAAPDEGNMFLLGRAASDDQKDRFLTPLVNGSARSAFFMTEPAEEGGAGSDPSMLKTTARQDGNHWVISGEKTFITGAVGASVGIIMAQTEQGATMFLCDLPDPAIEIAEVLDTIDSSMPGGHSRVRINELRLPSSQMLGDPGSGFRLAQIRLAPARLTHCMRWTGLALRAQEIATAYACQRQAFGKLLIDHEGAGFALAQNKIDLQTCHLLIGWCADALDRGETGNVESSIAKVQVSELLFQIADRCVQVMGGSGVRGDTIVEQFFREARAFRIYDGPTEVHKWSLAKKIKRAYLEANP